MMRVLRQAGRLLARYPASRAISQSFSKVVEGSGFTKKVFITSATGEKVSPWHDIAPWAGCSNELCMVSEIPRHDFAYL